MWGAIPELAHDEKTALAVPAENSKALADTICRLLGNNDLGRKIGRAARAKVETKYSTEAMLDGMEAVCRSAIR